MKCVILAGGKGTRLSEETKTIPKPMLEVGNKPILHHIMDIFMTQGINDFIICGGYRWAQIVGYFYSLNPKISMNGSNEVGFTMMWPMYPSMECKVSIMDTGLETQTGGRLRRIRYKLKEPFVMTYGDGLANVNIKQLVQYHKNSNALCTITAVHPEGRFGRLEIMNDGLVTDFGEKIESSKDWINGGFMVIDPKVLELIHEDSDNFEKDILPSLARAWRLRARKHDGFWKCVDSLRDLEELRELYKNGK